MSSLCETVAGTDREKLHVADDGAWRYAVYLDGERVASWRYASAAQGYVTVPTNAATVARAKKGDEEPLERRTGRVEIRLKPGLRTPEAARAALEVQGLAVGEEHE
jgi:hypothetical protein